MKVIKAHLLYLMHALNWKNKKCFGAMLGTSYTHYPKPDKPGKWGKYIRKINCESCGKVFYKK